MSHFPKPDLTHGPLTGFTREDCQSLYSPQEFSPGDYFEQNGHRWARDKELYWNSETVSAIFVDGEVEALGVQVHKQLTHYRKLSHLDYNKDWEKFDGPNHQFDISELVGMADELEMQNAEAKAELLNLARQVKSLRDAASLVDKDAEGEDSNGDGDYRVSIHITTLETLRKAIEGAPGA